MAGVFLRQSTASQSRAIGPFIDDTDFKTAETGLTVANTDIKLVVNGAASANKNSGGGTHRVNGVYGVTFDATDTATVGEVEVSVLVAGALLVFHKFYVLEEAVYDAMFAASALGYVANAPVSVAQFGGSNGTFASGIPEVKVASIAADAVNATALAANAASEVATAVRTELGTELGRVDVAVSTRLASAGYTAPLDAAGTRTAVGLASANLDTQIALLATAANLAVVAGYLDTEIAAIKAKTDNLPTDPADQSLVEAAILGILTTQLTESYNVDGTAPTVAQALFVIMQRLTEFAIAGTTITVKKLDGSTTALTLTLDDGTNPTSSTRAT